MSRPTPPTYRTRNWPAYNEGLKRRGSLTIWFDPEMSWDGAPTGRRGHQQIYSDAAIQTCLSMKVLFGMALRQTTGFAESLLRLVGLDWTVPDFSTLSRRQKTLAVNIPYCGSKGPLHLLIDSTGIKVEGEGEWHALKHGGPKRRVWRKIHLGIDEETLEIRAVEISGSHIGEAPVLPDLLGQIPADQEIGIVTADGAYDTRNCHDAIADRGAHAVIPPGKNAKPWKTVTAGAVARNEALRASKYLGRALWRRWSGYHRRSRVETKMHCVKLLEQRLMARDFERQVAEFQVRIAVLNGYTALGIPVTEAVGQVRSGKGEPRRSADMCNRADCNRKDLEASANLGFMLLYNPLSIVFDGEFFMFKLSRGGNNVPAEVQRWQYFLLKNNIPQVGIIDAIFGNNSETGTKVFQMQNGLTANGRVDEKTLKAAATLGYNILPKNYYKKRSGIDWPPKPAKLKSPTNAWRNKKFTAFDFIQKSKPPRHDEEAIVVKGSHEGKSSDWEEDFIVNFYDNRFEFASGYRGYIRCHKLMVPRIKSLLDDWEDASLLHLVLNYAGCFVPRYKRDKAPHPTKGHGKKSSAKVSNLSNHSFGSAIDISTHWNRWKKTPALCGNKGSVRELVEIANNAGFYWGGHYNKTKDGMHFEMAK